MYMCLSLCGSPGLSHNLAGSFPVIKSQLTPPAVHRKELVTRVEFCPFLSDVAAGLDRNAASSESLPSVPLSILYREVTSC